MEAATAFAVADYFGMDSLAIHFTFDNPRRREHILLTDSEKDQRRSLGNATMIQLALDSMRGYLDQDNMAGRERAQ
jgi:hypothetical protein